jgi:glycosyltransferase involved in cell wall biosynthesis
MLRAAVTIAPVSQQQSRVGVLSSRAREAFGAAFKKIGTPGYVPGRGEPPGGHTMRILITMPWGHRLGGAEAMLQTVLDGAQASGHELELVFMQAGPWPVELREAGLRVEVLDAGRMRDIHRWLATVARLARIFRRRRPGLILNWSAKTQLYGAPAAVLAGMSDRVVWWQHAIQARHWIDRCATALPAIAIGCSSETVARAQRQLSPSRPTFVVAPGTRPPGNGSQAGESNTFVANGRAPAFDGELATNGGPFPGDAHPSGNTATPLDLPTDVPIVGLVGRLEPWKGQDRMIGAQALLRERGHRIHTVMVGGDAYDISPEYARSLPGLVERLGLVEDVTMTGQVSDAGPYIERMDILVNASNPEPFGIVLLEGMARGVPVVAVDSGGPAELVENGRTGVLARAGDPEALADALEPLLASPVLRQTVGAAGRERYAEEFTDAAMRERFFERLQGLAERPRKRGDAGVRASAAMPRECPVTIVAHDIGSVGGMERQLAELALGLRRAGHEVEVIARTCELPPEAGVVFHRVRGPSRPFVVAYPWFALVGSLLVWRHRRGVVQATGAIVLNRVDAISVHCCHQVHRASPNRPLPLLRWYVRAVGLIARVCERLCFRANRAATFVCVSDGVAAEMREHFPELADRVVAIHNGVDTDAFSPGTRTREAGALRERLELAPGRLVLAFVGGDWGHKGLRTVIEALARAPEWDLMVAGRGHVAPYQQLADSLGVGGAVHWLGVVREMPVVYELADAFVLASGYETFSLVTFEAAASGLPIVATPVNGVRELIEDGRNGFLVAPDPEVIAERLCRLAEDPALRERVGAAARRSALAFSWGEMVVKHESLYERLAG